MYLECTVLRIHADNIGLNCMLMKIVNNSSDGYSTWAQRHLIFGGNPLCRRLNNYLMGKLYNDTRFQD